MSHEMIHLLDEKLDRKNFKNYALQSALASVIIFASLCIPFVENEILIAAIGSTAFIVFAMPYRLTARPRNVLGGHLACGLIGLLFSQLNETVLPQTVIIGLAVGVAIFAMVTLDIEHPPAGGTVIFLALTPNIPAFLTLLLLASTMSLICNVMKPYMIDLI